MEGNSTTATAGGRRAAQSVGGSWIAALLLAAILAVALIAHAVGSVSQVSFVYGGL